MHSFKKQESTGTKNSVQAKTNQGISLVDNRAHSALQLKLASNKGNNSPKNSVIQQKTKVFQLVYDASRVDVYLRNVQLYANGLWGTYGAALIERVIRENRLEIRGHASGDAGDGMQGATMNDLAALTPLLQAAKAAQVAEEPEVEHKQKPAPAKHQKPQEKAASDAAKAKKKADQAQQKKAAFEAAKAANFGKTPKKK